MPYKVTEDLYSDANPVSDAFAGEVKTGGGAFQVASKGGVLSDADAERLGLTGQLEHVTEQQLRDENEARNVATYNRGGGGENAPKSDNPAAAAPDNVAASDVTGAAAPATVDAKVVDTKPTGASKGATSSKK